MYAKIFASLYQGTLRGRSDEILVFTNLLAHTSVGGVVDKHFRAIAEETGLSMERVKAAIENLEAPDPESRSPDHDGARIIRLDEHRVWGWVVVNHDKYRAIRSEADRSEQNRLAQQRHRAKVKAQKGDGDRKQNADGNSDRNNSKQSKPKQKQEAEAEAEAFSPQTPPETPDVEHPLTDGEGGGVNFPEEPPMKQICDWDSPDFSTEGKPALIQHCLQRYPSKEKSKIAADRYLTTKSIEELREIKIAVDELAEFYDSLSAEHKRYLPMSYNYFPKEMYQMAPHEIFRSAPMPPQRRELSESDMRRQAEADAEYEERRLRGEEETASQREWYLARVAWNREDTATRSKIPPYATPEEILEYGEGAEA